MSSDLLRLTAELVDIPSVSHEEGPIVDHLQSLLEGATHLEQVRVGDNLVARTTLGRPSRLLLAGHTDTVPPSGDPSARIEGEMLHGLGAADMKGGLAVMVDLARRQTAPAVDVTYVWYAREEVAVVHSGLAELAREAPDLLLADVAILGEPTGGALEAGCQGTMRLAVTLAGRRAHTARAWMGRNAVHRLGAVLSALDGYEVRRPVIDGCTYREALQAVAVSGGVAGNVVPDEASVVLNHRFAPDRSADEARASVEAFLAPLLDEDDTVEMTECASGAAPGLDHPLLAALVARGGLEVRAKLGWTDVAFFAERGVPAANLGPGDPELAHTADERVSAGALAGVAEVLDDLVANGP